ncbi:multiple antibiotic resistance protein [Saccharicrinis carchari]|uniref:UPF0056 membrane protein n=1 Tax=Saccharicrinis carchari TaxID=1168039 RepID=A0A521AEG9_SACCC|nr:MarC family protein [Saccharicrinis carchari]SMO33197.1 multiple antibiotic resistance protein [Saccharicrinis carchari]
MDSLTIYIGFAITVFMGFFAIINPIANLPVYMTIVAGANKAQKKEVKRKAVTIAFLIVLSFIILGKIIFSLFGLTIPAFKIAGGILIFLAGVDMMRSKTPHEDADSEKGNKFNPNVAISPLATPLMAGPGSIVTAMTFVSGRGWIEMGIVILMFGIICLLHFLIFRMSGLIIRKLGKNVIKVIGRIMGLIITVIGTGMVLNGIQLAFDI